MSLLLWQRLVDYICVVSLWALYPVALIYLSLLLPTLHYLDYCNLIVCLEVNSVSPGLCSSKLSWLFCFFSFLYNLWLNLWIHRKMICGFFIALHLICRSYWEKLSSDNMKSSYPYFSIRRHWDLEYIRQKLMFLITCFTKSNENNCFWVLLFKIPFLYLSLPIKHKNINFVHLGHLY